MTGQRRALIVANDEYRHDGLRRLLAPAADAEALARVLGDPAIGDFEVTVVRNESAHAINAHIEDLFADSRADDVLLLHFSCHGLKNDAGELYFAATNTRPDRLGSTAVSADFVQACMRASRSRSIVLLLDCCYGGAFSQGVTVRAAGDAHVLDSFPADGLGGGRGRAVITASSSMEYAFEGDQLAADSAPHPSIFTAALVEGLSTGDADRDEDGWVSLNELYDYVFDRVRDRNPHQTPSRAVEMQGELFLARSRRRRIRAAAVPPDLLAATTDTNMFARLGAVTELRSRLLSDNLPAAVGAGEVLAEIVRSDIQYVAEAAAAALREAEVRPEIRAVHLQPVPVGADAPRRTVRLLGPPIARACVAREVPGWITVNEAPDALEIRVDTSRPGRLLGGVLLRGPTGEAVITVDIEVTPRVEAAAAGPATAGTTAAPAAPPPAASPPAPSPPAATASGPADAGAATPPAPVGAAAPGGPVTRSAGTGWRLPVPVLSAAMIVVGLLTVVLTGFALNELTEDAPTAFRIFAVQLAGIGVLYLLRAAATGGRSRVAYLVAGLVALVAALGSFDPRLTGIGVVFWLVGGPLELVAARPRTGPAAARRWQLTGAAIGTLVAVLLLLIAIGDYDNQTRPIGVIFGVWTVVLAVTLIATGVLLRGRNTAIEPGPPGGA